MPLMVLPARLLGWPGRSREPAALLCLAADDGQGCCAVPVHRDSANCPHVCCRRELCRGATWLAKAVWGAASLCC